MRQPEDLSPREAHERYCGRRATETTDGSMKAYRYRLKLFVEWCEENDVESVSEFSGWIFEEFRAHRAGEGIASSTMNNEMQTLKNFVEYLEAIEAVDEELAEKVQVPTVPKSELSSETKLATEDAQELIGYYRSADHPVYASRLHAVLELAWHTGARLGALRALDLRDFDADERFVEFVHRPETDTPLKNKVEGERVVGLAADVCEVVESFVSDQRWDVHDEHGRAPLLASTRGRPHQNTLRVWMYQATMPCSYKPCPHGHDPDTCEFTRRNFEGGCPSTRSPHQVRTGSITWHRDSGVPPSVTSERVNASKDVIDRHYDKATRRERMELRRRPHLDKLHFES